LPLSASRYLGLLETSFVVSRLPAWRGAGVARLIKSPKLLLADSGLAAHLAGAKDIGGLRSFLAAAPRCRAGVLVHNGTESVSLGDRLWALPLGLVVS
jgi:hypothetical protein